MKLNRRAALARMGLAGLGGVALAQMPFAARATVSARLGTAEVTSLSDGHLVLPRSFFFDGLPEAELTEVLDDYDLPPEQLTPPCNVTLLRDGNRLVLFDAGSGPGFMPSAGALRDSLAALDVAPEEVTHVVFTHGHPDHLWGVLDDFNDPVFANATYLMGTDEWNYWRDPATVDSIGDARAAFAVGAARRLAAIEDRMQAIDDGQEILPGVMARASFGHTPGHMSFELRHGTEALWIGGDAIGNHHIAFARPDWPSGADQNPDLGAETRKGLLDQLAAEQTLLMGFHLPGGGLGRVARDGEAYRFVRADQ